MGPLCRVVAVSIEGMVAQAAADNKNCVG